MKVCPSVQPWAPSSMMNTATHQLPTHTLTHTHTQIRTLTHMQTQRFGPPAAHTHTHEVPHDNEHTRAHTHTHIHTSTYTYTYIYTNAATHTHTCLSLSLYIYIYIYINTICMYTAIPCQWLNPLASLESRLAARSSKIDVGDWPISTDCARERCQTCPQDGADIGTAGDQHGELLQGVQCSDHEGSPRRPAADHFVPAHRPLVQVLHPIPARELVPTASGPASEGQRLWQRRASSGEHHPEGTVPHCKGRNPWTRASKPPHCDNYRATIFKRGTGFTWCHGSGMAICRTTAQSSKQLIEILIGSLAFLI